MEKRSWKNLDKTARGVFQKNLLTLEGGLDPSVLYFAQMAPAGANLGQCNLIPKIRGATLNRCYFKEGPVRRIAR